MILAEVVDMRPRQVAEARQHQQSGGFASHVAIV